MEGEKALKGVKNTKNVKIPSKYAKSVNFVLKDEGRPNHFSPLKFNGKQCEAEVGLQSVQKNTETDRNGPKRTGTDMKNDRNRLEIDRNGLEIDRNGLEIDRNGL